MMYLIGDLTDTCMLCVMCVLYVLICSATWPPGVRRLSQSYLMNPFHVYVGSLDLRVHTLLCTCLFIVSVSLSAGSEGMHGYIYS